MLGTKFSGNIQSFFVSLTITACAQQRENIFENTEIQKCFRNNCFPVCRGLKTSRSFEMPILQGDNLLNFIQLEVRAIG